MSSDYVISTKQSRAAGWLWGKNLLKNKHDINYAIVPTSSRAQILGDVTKIAIIAPQEKNDHALCSVST